MVAEAGTGGRRLRPHVVREVRGRPDLAPQPPVTAGIQADPAAWNAVREALVRVVAAGTATSVRIPGVVAAGKTGTAQNPHGDDHALFVCYAPAEEPEIAMAFVIENSGHGGSVAAPKAAHVLRRMFLPDSLQTDYVPPPPPAPPDTNEVERVD
jgi:penicillin-binding protein 2